MSKPSVPEANAYLHLDEPAKSGQLICGLLLLCLLALRIALVSRMHAVSSILIVLFPVLVALLYIFGRSTRYLSPSPRILYKETWLGEVRLFRQSEDLSDIKWVQTRWTVSGCELVMGSGVWSTVNVMSAALSTHDMTLRREKYEAVFDRTRVEISAFLNITDKGWEKLPGYPLRNTSR